MSSSQPATESRAEIQRRLAAIIAADVAGYSRMMGKDEEGTLLALKAVNSEVIVPKVAARQGRIFKLTGDGFLAEFPSVVEAMRCAIDVQQTMALRGAELPEERRIRFRMGVHLGDIIIDGDDVFGDGVNVAARLEGLAAPGGICVHLGVRNEVRDRLPVAFEDLGQVEVKNIARPVRAFRVLLDGSAPASPPSRSATIRSPWAVVRPWHIAASLAVVSALALGSAVSPWRPWAPNAETSEAEAVLAADKASIAVLPFTNVSGEAEQDYFADGLTEDLITQLSSISDLFVIARSSVLPYKGASVSPQEVRRDLGVRYLLEGSVRKSGDRLRINANLVETQSAQQLWAEQYDRQISDVFEVQDEVIGQIASALAIELTDTEQEQLARIPTDNLEAYDYFLRAETEGYYNADEKTLGRALAFYEKAIELDLDFAQAHAGYARAAVEIWRLDYNYLLTSAVAQRRAYEAAGRALELDPNNARAYTALAILQLGDGRHVEAIASARRAVALNPSDAEALANLGVVLAYSGELKEAVDVTEQALRLNPMAPPGFRILAGTVFYNARQYDRAAREFKAVLSAWPSNHSAHEYLAPIYARQGDTERARREIEALPYVSEANLRYHRLLYEGYYRREGDLNHHLEGLKLAGLTEWPFGFDGQQGDRVTGAALEELVADRTWKGYTPVRGGEKAPFIQQIDAENRVAFRGAKSFLTGRARIENDQLCLRFDGYLRTRWLCGDVYRNPDAAADGADYVHVLADGLRYFSVEA